MSCFDHIAGKIIIGNNGTSYGADSDSVALNAHFIYYLGNQSVNDTVGTAGAEVHTDILKSVRLLIYSHYFSSSLAISFI